MSNSALERLFNSVEGDKQPSTKPTLEEQLLIDDEEDESLFLEGMSESSRNSLIAKVASQTVEKVEYKEEPGNSESIKFDPETGEVIETNTNETTLEDDESLDIERPAEKPITQEDIESVKEEKDDVAEELVQQTKSRRGRKPKVKEELGGSVMEKEVNNVGTIMHVLGVTMLQDMLKSDYKFREFGKEDTALIIKYLLSKVEGE